MFLLCTCMALAPMHAQEIADSLQISEVKDSVARQTACVPVMSTAEDSLVFQAGERLEFALQYTWGAMHTDVGYATISLDSLTFNGEEAFLISAYGKTVKFFDWVFKVREDFKSWFTRDGLRPLKFTRDTYEGGYEARASRLKKGGDDIVVENSVALLEKLK